MSLIDTVASKLGYTRKPTVAPPAVLRGVHVRQVRTRSQSGFAAGEHNRLTADFSGSPTISIDSILRTQGRTIRNRARLLCRDDDYAKGFIRLLKTNVVGANGLRLTMAVANEDGVSQDTAANDVIEAAWREFSMPENFTTTGRLSRVELEHLLIESTARDGEFLFRMVSGWDNPFGFALQPIDIDYLDEEKNQVLPSGNVIRMGVEMDRWRRPVAYWLRTWNPGDVYSFSLGSKRTERFPAEDFVHGFTPMYFEQARGVSWFHTALTRLNMLMGYQDATLVTSRAAACQPDWITQDVEHPVSEITGDELSADGSWLENKEPGEAPRVLPPGAGIVHSNPNYPQTQHGDYVKAILRGIARGLGVSYNSLASDLESVNYGSLRAGALEDRDVYKLVQGWLIKAYAFRVFGRWLDMALVTGALRWPRGGAIKSSEFRRLNRPTFNGRRWDWVDPEKDHKANQLALDNVLTTRQAIIGEADMDFEDVCRQRQREDQIAQAHGITLPAPGTMTRPGQVPAADDDGEGEDGRDDDQAEAEAEMRRIEAIRSRVDTYGVAVRAGVITPILDDENQFRQELGLTPITTDVRRAWDQDAGVRRPITLVQTGQAAGVNQPGRGPGQPDPDDTEEE